MVNSPASYAARVHLVAMRQLLELRQPVADHHCSHPEEARIQTAAMGKPNAFFCSACKFEVGG